MARNLEHMVQTIENEKKQEIHSHARDLLGEVHRSVEARYSRLFPKNEAKDEARDPNQDSSPESQSDHS